MLKVLSSAVRLTAASSKTINLATTAGLGLVLYTIFDILPLLEVVLLPALNGLQGLFYLAGCQGDFDLCIKIALVRSIQEES